MINRTVLKISEKNNEENLHFPVAFSRDISWNFLREQSLLWLPFCYSVKFATIFSNNILNVLKHYSFLTILKIYQVWLRNLYSKLSFIRLGILTSVSRSKNHYFIFWVAQLFTSLHLNLKKETSVSILFDHAQYFNYFICYFCSF